MLYRVTELLIPLVVNALAVLATVRFVPGVQFDFGDAWWKLVVVAGILALVNTFLKPVLKILSFPIRLFTLGLFTFVINVTLILLVAYVSGRLDLDFTLGGWPREGFGLDTVFAALLASLVISVVSTALSVFVGSARLVTRF